jgi:hypothetical protein
VHALAAGLACLGFTAIACAQEVVVSVTRDYALGGPRPLLVIDDLARAWAIPDFMPSFVTSSSPHAINPHAIAMLDRDHVAVANAGKPWIDLVDLAGAMLDGFIVPAGDDYSGYGTIALNPAGTHLLLASGSTSVANDNRRKLWVVPTPLASVSVASHFVTLSGRFGTAQTSAIAFDPTTGRAYVAHDTGISAIDPPYTQASLAYTIALPPLPPDPAAATGRSIMLAPDGAVLLSAESSEGRPLTVVRAPFSASSIVETLAIAGSEAIDGIAFTPDGSRALIADRQPAAAPLAGRTQIFVVESPYSPAAPVERLAFLDAYESNGYEYIAMSPDGRFAVLSGAGFDADEDLRIVRAPFTEVAFRSRRIAVPGLAPPYLQAGRGAGMAVIWPEPVSTPPQLSIDRSSITEGDSGTRALRLTVHLSNVSTMPVAFDYATVEDSAVAGVDFAAKSGTLILAPGSRRQSIDVVTFTNTVAQPDRTFRIVLANPVNARLLQTSARDGEGLIVDDDDSTRAVIVTDPPLPEGVVGAPYASAPFAAINLVTTVPPEPRWQLSGYGDRVPGLAISMDSGVLAGTPERAGTYYILVEASGDFPQVAQREYPVVVRDDRLFADGFDTP